MTKCLILSHAFNMDGRAASQTITDKIPYLIDAQFSLYVLSAITGSRDDRFFHQQLISWGPSAFRFDFRHWIALRFGRGSFYKIITSIVSILLLPFVFLEKILIGLSNQWSWALPAFFYGVFLIKRHKIDVIYSTGGAWSAHCAGYLLKLVTGCTWLAEIHDPLVVRIESCGIFIDKSNRDRRLQIWLEKKISVYADMVWWFTRGALDCAIKRHPDFLKNGFYILPGSAPPSSNFQYMVRDKFHIGYFGSLSDSRSLSQLLAALPDFFIKNPKAINSLKIDVFGSSLDGASKKYIKKYNLSDNLVVHGRIESDATGLSGRERVLQYMQGSDVLLLLHGNYEGCSEYIPSKLYEYWWSRRPILGITHKNPELNGLLASINGTSEYTADVNDVESISLALSAAWMNWLAGTDFQCKSSPINVDIGVKNIIARYDSLSKAR